MELTDISGNTGTRMVTLTLFGGELVNIISDSRWLLLAIVLCVIADFRYGWGESHKRFEHARLKNDKVVMSQYKWRTSRAVRRTINKLIDYVVWICVGMAVGMAVISPMGVDYRWGGVVAAIVAILCEGKSVLGHFFYLHGLQVDQKSVRGFFKAFVVAFAKRKDKDIGEAIESGFNEIDKEDKNESKQNSN